MDIEYWAILWKVVLVVGVGLFAILAVVVTIGGALDIGRLFKTLREEHARAIAENADGGNISDSHEPHSAG